MANRKIKLNCDLGESFGHYTLGCDSEAMAEIDMANIACGFHAGDPSVMANTLALAKKYNVEIGAHPSYPDRQGFGRRSMTLNKDELTHLLHYQIATLEGMAKVQGLDVSYVKPHGALYNDMMADTELFECIVSAISAYPSPLKLMVLSQENNNRNQAIADKHNVTLIFEVFADRRYNDDGSLVSRTLAGAVLSDELLLRQIEQLKTQDSVTTLSGNTLQLQCDSLCVHGDNPSAISQIKRINALLNNDK